MERVQKIFHLKGIYVNIRVARYGDFSLTLMTFELCKIFTILAIFSIYLLKKFKNNGLLIYFFRIS